MTAQSNIKAATHPYSRTCYCESCTDAWIDGAGETNVGERAGAWQRVVDMIDAMPKRPGPSEAELAAARERADNAVRGLLSDAEFAVVTKGHRKFVAAGVGRDDRRG